MSLRVPVILRIRNAQCVRESPSFNSKRYQESPDKKKDDLVHVLIRDDFRIGNAKQWQKYKRYQRGNCKMHHFGEPPDRHPYGDGRHFSDSRIPR